MGNLRDKLNSDGMAYLPLEVGAYFVSEQTLGGTFSLIKDTDIIGKLETGADKPCFVTANPDVPLQDLSEIDG